MLKPLITLFLLYFLVGCAMHPPASEHIVFIPDEVVKKDYWYSKMDASFTQVQYSSKMVKHYNNKYPQKKNEFLYNSFTLPGISLTRSYSNKFSISVNTGILAVGAAINTTFRLANSYYTTLQFGLNKRYEIIIQKRVFKDPNFGISTGLFARSDKILNRSQNGSSSFITQNGVRFSVYGVRFLTDFNYLRKQMRLSLYAALEHESKSPYFALGLNYSFNLNPLIR